MSDYCEQCHMFAHEGPCEKRVGLTGQERANAERSFMRGLRRADGQGDLAPLDPGDTRDLWEDGQ